MTAMPIKEGIENLLRNDEFYTGVWEISGMGKYIKLSSELGHGPIKIPAGKRSSVEDAIRCAKVYKELARAGMYPPETEVVVCAGRDGSLSLMVLMPKLDIKYGGGARNKVLEKIQELRKRLKLGDMPCADMLHTFNWGYSPEGRLYAHDLHLSLKGYKSILKMAKKTGIK